MEEKEIGGYFELEGGYGKEFHSGIALNSGRNCLQLLIREYRIKTIYLPYYLCLVINDTCLDEQVKIVYYHINKEFLPELSDISLDQSSYVYIVNYFGFLGKSTIKELKKKYRNIIIDNTHAFFDEAVENVPTIYNCRKYFGVPDGAYLSAEIKDFKSYPIAKSSQRMSHLIGRMEETANRHYSEFLKADQTFDHCNIEQMSKLTHSLLKNINYQKAKEIREQNFAFLNEKLKEMNQITIDNVYYFMYPLLIKDGSKLRDDLISHKIYIPKLWPELDCFPLNEFEQNVFENLVCIPIDQRYSLTEMKYMVKLIFKYLGGVA